MTAIKVAVVLLFCTTLGHGHELQTKTVDGNSGLYFEETGKIFFYNNEWKIVSNVNLTDYRTELHNIRNTVELITKNCEELKLIETERNASSKGSKGCGPLLHQLGVQMADIEENDSNWFGKDTRVKRNSVSELFVDDWPEDHLSLFEQFRNMSARESMTSTWPEQETSYISSTLNAAGKMTEKHRLFVSDFVTEQLTLVTKTLDAARNGSVLVQLLQNIQSQSHIQTLQDIIPYQMQMLASFSSKQKQYLSVLSLVGTKQHAQLTGILASDTLLGELNNIRGIVSERGLDFPLKLTSSINVRSLFQHSAPEVTLLDDQIFVTFHLPLMSRLSGNHFTLLKATSSLHNLQDNLYSFIVPNHDFIAIDAHRERYTTLTVDDLNNCLRISNVSAILCKQTASVMPMLTSSECEIVALNKREPSVDKSNNCRRRYIRTNAEIFIKTLKANSWLITMPKTTKIRYMCDGMATQEYFVRINGLLTIDSNCKLATDRVLIAGHNSLSKIPIQELPSQNSSRYDVSLDDFTFDSNDVPQVISFGDSERLLQISYSRHDIKVKAMVVANEEMDQRIREITEILIVALSLFLIWTAFMGMAYLYNKYQISRIKLNTIRSRAVRTTTSNVSEPSAPSIP